MAGERHHWWMRVLPGRTPTTNSPGCFSILKTWACLERVIPLTEPQWHLLAAIGATGRFVLPQRPQLCFQDELCDITANST